VRSPELPVENSSSTNRDFLLLGLRFPIFLGSGDGVLVTTDDDEFVGGESDKVSLFLGLVRVGKSNLAIPVFGLANLDMLLGLPPMPLGGVE